MSEPTADQLTRLTMTVLHQWRAALQAEWGLRSSITNPRNDLSRDIDLLDAILGDRWQLTIVPASRKEDR